MEDELFEVVTRAYPYRELSRKDYDDLLTMLADGIASQRGRFGAYLLATAVNKRLKARPRWRDGRIMNGGAPETARQASALGSDPVGQHGQQVVNNPCGKARDKDKRA